MQLTNRRPVRRGAPADEVNERGRTRIDRRSADVRVPPVAGGEYLSPNERLVQNGRRCRPQCTRRCRQPQARRTNVRTDTLKTHITYRAEASTDDNVLKALRDAEALTGSVSRHCAQAVTLRAVL